MFGRFNHQLLLLLILINISGCGGLAKKGGDTPSQEGKPAGIEAVTAVDVAIARTGTLQEAIEYTGTTAPFREVSVRSQIEGKLLSLNVEVADYIEQGTQVARLDDALLVANVIQAEAELAARGAEVARAETEVSKARTAVEQARLKLQQLVADADRLEKLADEGAVSRQSAEQKRTEADTALQALRAAQVQISTEEQAVAALEGRVKAQTALIAQAKERLTYTVINSPISGVVTQRLSEAGNLVQAGNEILKIGDFSQVKIVVNISELELANLRKGQNVDVKLDAFAKENITGYLSQISPAADATSRLVPVEITIDNVNSKIGSGLLARVSFTGRGTQQILVPEAALQAGGRSKEATGNNKGNPNKKRSDKNPSGTIFIVKQEGEKSTVEARSVILGERGNGQVEIISGLQVGEKFVARAGKPLKNGEPVRLSILSEK